MEDAPAESLQKDENKQYSSETSANELINNENTGGSKEEEELKENGKEDNKEGSKEKMVLPVAMETEIDGANEDNDKSVETIKNDEQQTTNGLDDQQTTTGLDEVVNNEQLKQDDHMTTTETGEDTETDRGEDKRDPSSSETPKEGSEQEESKHSSTSSRTSSRERKTGDSSRAEKKKERRKKKHSSSVPKLRRKTSKIGNAAEHYVQSILLSYFQAFDQNNIGLITPDNFWNILISAELNLQLNQVDIQLVQQSLPLNEQGYILYMEFVTMAQQLINSIYSGQPDTQTNWVELRGYDGTVVNYNKKTGEIIDNAESGMDLFEATLKDIFQKADEDNKGYISLSQFKKVMESGSFTLSPVDKEDLINLFPEGNINFAQFQPVGKELILRIYRTKDDTGNPDTEWTQVTSPKVGSFWLNKVTGETRRNPEITEEGKQDAVLINQAYSQIDTLNLQLEQERVRSRELENQVAITNEELEVTASQLDETGRQLDEITIELQLRETEVSQLQTIISEKDQHIDELSSQVVEVTTVEDDLIKLQKELEEKKRQLQDKEIQLAGKDQSIDDLKMESGAIIDELKNAHGIIDARESSIDSLEFNLNNEQGRVKHLKQQMPSLETRLSMMMNELVTNKRNLEEKTAILLQTRDSLKKARTKNIELERENTQLTDVANKLKNAECEIRTLKSFLTSKTAMVERRKKEIQELKIKMSEVETRDNRRAIILADVLEKTARTFQQQLTSPRQQQQQQQQQQIKCLNDNISESRSLSAPPPLTPINDTFNTDTDPLSMSYNGPPTNRGGIGEHPPLIGAKLTKSQPKRRGHIKARTVPRLPPIKKRQLNFVVPTEHDIKRHYREKDNKTHPHTSSVNCQCEMCTFNRSSPAAIDYSINEGGAALSRLKLEADQREYQLAKQLKLGQRAIIQIKKSMFDLEPQKLPCTIKYVGKVDGEFVDNRIYVGVKLDDPVGNTDGIYKGRRYFSCPPLNGKMVRITNVLAVLSNKSLVYTPLQIGTNPLTNTSPYANNGIMQQQKRSPLRIT